MGLIFYNCPSLIFSIKKFKGVLIYEHIKSMKEYLQKNILLKHLKWTFFNYPSSILNMIYFEQEFACT